MTMNSDLRNAMFLGMIDAITDPAVNHDLLRNTILPSVVKDVPITDEMITVVEEGMLVYMRGLATLLLGEVEEPYRSRTAAKLEEQYNSPICYIS